jgi:hypothetical protein
MQGLSLLLFPACLSFPPMTNCVNQNPPPKKKKTKNKKTKRDVQGSIFRPLVANLEHIAHEEVQSSICNLISIVAN